MIREEVKIISKEYLTKDVLKVEFEKPKEFQFKPGQFINIKFEQEGSFRMRAYSILNTPSEETLDICLKLIPGGLASESFKEAKENDKYTIIGPFGYFQLNEKEKEHVFISTGTGVVPFISMIKEFVKKDYKMTLIAGYKKKENILYQEELKKIEQENKNFVYKPTITREEWTGLKGRVQKYLPEDLSKKMFYICGLKEFVIETKELLLERGVNEKYIKVERYN